MYRADNYPPTPNDESRLMECHYTVRGLSKQRYAWGPWNMWSLGRDCRGSYGDRRVKGLGSYGDCRR